MIDQIVKTFKALSDPTRLRLTALLASRGEISVWLLAASLDLPHSVVSRHLGILKSAGIVKAERDGNQVLYSLDRPDNQFDLDLLELLVSGFRDTPATNGDLNRFREAVGMVGGEPRPGRKRILFLCTGNSCRSQMAEAWARHLCNDAIEAYSAGTENHGLNPRAIQVMAEVGVDMSFQHSKTLTDLLSQDPGLRFDIVVTVCGHARETCPVIPGVYKAVHAGFDDPPTLARDAHSEEEALAHYRRVRDEIRDFVKNLKH